MVLFHGTNEIGAISIVENGINLKKGLSFTDFGKGFYATKDPEFAWSCGKRKLDTRTESRIAVIKFEFDLDAASPLIRLFDPANGGYNLEWAQFIANNRCGPSYVKAIGATDHNLDFRYAICRGNTADGDVTDFTKKLSKEKRPVRVDEVSIFMRDRRQQYPEQFTFHTEEALRYISKIERVI
jgi:hypothetical protein